MPALKDSPGDSNAQSVLSSTRDTVVLPSIGPAASGSPGKIARNTLSSPENLLELPILRPYFTHKIRNPGDGHNNVVLTSLR